MLRLFKKIKGFFAFGSIFVMVLFVIAASQLFIWLFPVLLIAVFIYASVRTPSETDPK